MTIRKVGATAAATCLCLFLSVLPAVSQDEFSVFPQDLFPDFERPLSRFPHEEHMVYDAIEDCWVCHHVYRDGELVEGETSEGVPCGECHRLEADDGVDRLSAYHQRCKGCHEDISRGPITCGECHVRD
jgi:hypothetical protein